jgi:RNA polymerase primary sigma factor
VIRVANEMQQRLGREVNDVEISTVLGIPPEKIRAYRRALSEPVSLESPISDQEDGSLRDMISNGDVQTPGDQAAREITLSRVREIMSTLPDREREVLFLRYGLLDERSHTLEEVAQIFKVTRERVRQIEQSGLRRLKQPSVAQDLTALLDST